MLVLGSNDPGMEHMRVEHKEIPEEQQKHLQDIQRSCSSTKDVASMSGKAVAALGMSRATNKDFDFVL